MKFHYTRKKCGISMEVWHKHDVNMTPQDTYRYACMALFCLQISERWTEGCMQ
jgi:hypothetical protein